MPASAMYQVRRQQARVVLANFLAERRWSGPWVAEGDGHCAIYAEEQVHSLPFGQMMRRRQSIARWIRNHLDHPVYQWSSYNRALDLSSISRRERRSNMRKTARHLVSKAIVAAEMVPRSAWLDAVSLQALAVRRGQPLIVLEERFRSSATGFSRYFLPMIFFHDGKDVIYDFGDDTEGTVRGVLESYPEARIDPGDDDEEEEDDDDEEEEEDE